MLIRCTRCKKCVSDKRRICPYCKEFVPKENKCRFSVTGFVKSWFNKKETKVELEQEEKVEVK